MVAVPTSLDGTPPADRKKRRWQRFFQNHLTNIAIFLMVLLLFFAVLYPYMLITVPSGHVGVLWKRFSGPGIYCWCILRRGTVLDPQELREEGLHIIWPWDTLFIYDLRLQSKTETYNTISRDGVNVVATITTRFQLQHNSMPIFHKYIGPGYWDSAIRPEIGSRAREVIAKYSAEEVYSRQRQVIEEQIRASAQEKLGPRIDTLVQPQASEQLDREEERYKKALGQSILILDTLLLGIELPAPIVGAINRKIEQFYLVQEYTYRVEREQKESERKQIEANGIQAFQRTVSQGISDSYLRWRGIEATLQLSQSPNSKIVIIGAGKDGVPIILGNVDTPPAATAPPAGPPSSTDTSAAGKETKETPPGGATTPTDKPPGSPTTPGATPTTPTTPTTPGATPTTPAANPADKRPVAGATPPASAGAGSSSDRAPAAGGTPPSAAKSDDSSPLSMSDIESFLARLARTIRGGGSEPAAAPTTPGATPTPAPTTPAR